jgi:thiol-disulfide isomerase/thioredoxin
LPLAFGAAIIALVAVIAVLTTRDTPGTAADEIVLDASPSAPVSRSAPEMPAALARFDPAAADPALGAVMPPLAGVDFDGSPVEVQADGRAKMVIFLAHWCPHCQREVPIVQQWMAAGNLPDGVDLVSVATAIDASRPNFPPDAWLEREGWTAPVIVDATGEIADRFGLSAFPFWVMVDAQGRVAARASGVLEPAQLDVVAGALADGRSPLEAGAE